MKFYVGRAVAAAGGSRLIRRHHLKDLRKKIQKRESQLSRLSKETKDDKKTEYLDHSGNFIELEEYLANCKEEYLKNVRFGQGPFGITPESISTGKIKWAQLKKMPYEQRVAVMVVARSLWNQPQEELAKLLDVEPNALEQFFSTVRTKVKEERLSIQNLKPHVAPEHYPSLEGFVQKTLGSQQ